MCILRTIEAITPTNYFGYEQSPFVSGRKEARGQLNGLCFIEIVKWE